jgi:hypothetical protein
LSFGKLKDFIFCLFTSHLGWLYEPIATTRNRKLLESLVPSFESVPPIWELRVGEYRVFYDVDEGEKIVYIRAIRRKKTEQTTEDIVQ